MKIMFVCFSSAVILGVLWPAHVDAAAASTAAGRLYEHFGDDGVIVDGERNRCDSERGR